MDIIQGKEKDNVGSSFPSATMTTYGRNTGHNRHRKSRSSSASSSIPGHSTHVNHGATSSGCTAMTSPGIQSAPPSGSEQELPHDFLWAVILIASIIIINLSTDGYSSTNYWLGFLLIVLMIWPENLPTVAVRSRIYYCIGFLFVVFMLWRDIIGPEVPLPLELDDWPDGIAPQSVPLGLSDDTLVSGLETGSDTAGADGAEDEVEDGWEPVVMPGVNSGSEDGSIAGSDDIPGPDSDSEAGFDYEHEFEDISDESDFEELIFNFRYDTDNALSNAESDESESDTDTKDSDGMNLDQESDRDIYDNEYDLERIIGVEADVKNATNITPHAEESFPFMRLPQELMDMIYKEYLTEPYGLVYTRHPKNRVVLSRLQRPINNPVGHEAWEMEDLGPLQPANQLQYVSRKLRQETRGLGVRYNDITFLSLARMHDPAAQLRVFFEALPVSYYWQKALVMRQWNIMFHSLEHHCLRHIGLHMFAVFLRGSPLQPSRIWRFLQQNPNFKVNVRMACFDPGNAWHRGAYHRYFPYLSQLIIAADMRGEKVAKRYRDLVTQDMRYVFQSRVSIAPTAHLPNNVRVMPFSFEFHEHAFLWAQNHECQDTQCEIMRAKFAIYHDSPQQAVKLLKLLYKEGC